MFSRTFLPATSEARLPIPVVSRHMPVLRRCVTSAEHTVLVTCCHRPGQPVTGPYLMLLTNRSLVVTRESRLLHRVRLHLAADIRTLTNVAWTPDLRLRTVEMAATTPEGLRERFWIPVRDVRQVAHLDAMFRHAFRFQAVASHTAPSQTPRLISPAGAA